ncbi:hypothetical protein PGT21_019842 [Puccinia graminis f. sp. tritici]|uniref:Uncharacterized protein n=2 Tax=Puccinia graminis f. sp. tritici TaxID=56615 RepID=A0A5B0PDT6_PUCGR|nr:hypothetical protein PGT21_019842 [Puccinia graminis f. sp. tritici]
MDMTNQDTEMEILHLEPGSGSIEWHRTVNHMVHEAEREGAHEMMAEYPGETLAQNKRLKNDPEEQPQPKKIRLSSKELENKEPRQLNDKSHHNSKIGNPESILEELNLLWKQSSSFDKKKFKNPYKRSACQNGGGKVKDIQLRTNIHSKSARK